MSQRMRNDGTAAGSSNVSLYPGMRHETSVTYNRHVLVGISWCASACKNFQAYPYLNSTGSDFVIRIC